MTALLEAGTLVLAASCVVMLVAVLRQLIELRELRRRQRMYAAMKAARFISRTRTADDAMPFPPATQSVVDRVEPENDREQSHPPPPPPQ